MNRQPWLHWYQQGSFPTWPCPARTTGSLRLQKLDDEETLASRRQGPHRHPMEYSGRFHGWLRCDRAGCGEVAVVIGEVGTDIEVDEEGHQDWVSIYRPTAISPPPPMFVPPKRCPEEVQKELVRAFGLYWIDPTAAGNALRSCVEHILTRRGVSRNSVSKGRRHRLTLHARIERFQKTHATAGDALMAVKWIGNEGSHGGLTNGDVLDAVDVIENVIDEFWGDRMRALSRLVAQVNRKRRPRSKVKRKAKNNEAAPGPLRAVSRPRASDSPRLRGSSVLRRGRASGANARKQNRANTGRLGSGSRSQMRHALGLMHEARPPNANGRIR